MPVTLADYGLYYYAFNMVAFSIFGEAEFLNISCLLLLYSSSSSLYVALPIDPPLDNELAAPKLFLLFLSGEPPLVGGPKLPL
jgi:hypothetical protein